MKFEDAKKVLQENIKSKEERDVAFLDRLKKEEPKDYDHEDLVRRAETIINVTLLEEHGGLEGLIRRRAQQDALEVDKTATYIKHLGVFNGHLDRVDTHLNRVDTHLARIETANAKQLEVFERFTTAIEKLVGMVETTMAKDNSYRSKS